MFARVVSVLAGLGCVLVLADAVGAAQPGETRVGRIFKWTDEKGVVHYGQSIPPEYRDQAATEMNKQGLTIKRIDAAATPEQRKAAEEKARLQKEEQKKVFEQRRRDTALLNTYTSTREIDEAKERSLSVPQQAIRGLEPRLKVAQERLTGLEGQADAIRKSGKPVPDHLKEDIADQKLEVDGMRAEIDRHRTQIDAIKNRYDADKQRYMELTQLAPR
jgi:uncharacterized protein DUF4124